MDADQERRTEQALLAEIHQLVFLSDGYHLCRLVCRVVTVFVVTNEGCINK